MLKEKMEKRNCLEIFLLVGLLLVLSLNFVSAVDDLMALQGIVKEGGSDLSSGDLVVTIWDDPTSVAAGNLIYNSTTDFNGVIVNGKYDVMLGNGSNSLTLDYGELYYLEIFVDGGSGYEAFTFNGSDRQVFQSSVGNVSFPTIQGFGNIVLSNESATFDAGKNVTLGLGGWFKGLFNWTVLNDWLNFDGASLEFNETRLNNTIGDYVSNVSFTSRWGGNATAIFNSTVDQVGIGTETPNAGLDTIVIGPTGSDERTYGVRAKSDGAYSGAVFDFSYGGYFEANGSRALNYNYGVYSSANSGVGNNAENYGVFGTASGNQSSGSNYGIYGSVSSTGVTRGYAGYFWAQGTNSSAIKAFRASANNVEAVVEISQTHITGNTGTVLTVMQNSTGDILNLYDNVTEVFTVVDGGNVGIGTATPTQTLDVRGSANFSGTIYINNETDIGSLLYNYTTATFGQYNDTWDNRDLISAVNETALINSLNTTTTSNLTIIYSDLSSINGTANIQALLNAQFISPSSLNVSGESNFGGRWADGGVTVTGGSIYAQSLFVYNITSLGVSTLEINGSQIPFLDNTFDIGNSTHRFRNIWGIAAVVNDSLIIGNTTATEKLEIYDGNFKITDGERTLNIKENGGASYQIDSTGFLVINSGSSSDINFNQNAGRDVLFYGGDGTLDMAVKNGNLVGIGTNSPTLPLDVRGAANFSGTIYINNETDVANLLYNYTTATFGQYNATWDNRLLIINSNISAGQYTEYVNTTIASYVDDQISGASVSRWSGNATAVFNSTVSQVGIGTDTPNGKLEVNQPNAIEDVLNLAYNDTVVFTVGPGYVGISNDGSLGGNFGPGAGLEVFTVGEHTGGGTAVYGVKGSSFQINSGGVERFSFGGYFNATGIAAANNLNYGVYGVAENTPGGAGTADNYGVYGNASSGLDKTVNNYGVYGYALGYQASGSNYGVYAYGIGNSSFGVYSEEGVNYFNNRTGIGTTTPTQTLDVRGAANFSGTIYINNETDVANLLYNYTTATFGQYNSTWDNRDLIIAHGWISSGDNIYNTTASVGIGDATPDGKLEVRQTAGDDSFNIYSDTTNVFTVGGSGAVGSSVVGISNDGTLGGVNGPAAGLEVSVTATSTDGGTSTYAVKGSSVQSESNANKLFSFGGYFNATGEGSTNSNVNYGVYGVVDATPGAGGAAVNYGLYGNATTGLNNNVNNYGVYGYAFGYQTTGSNYGVYAYGIGNSSFGVYSEEGVNYFNNRTGIGTTNPGSKLEVENTAGANDVLLLEDDSGLCEAQPTTTGLTWSCSSDRRLKSDIVDAQPIIDYLMNFTIRDYTVVKTGERAMGIIAQEVQEIYPEMVSEGDDGYLMVSEPSPWQMVKAIQELKLEIESLRLEIEELKESP